MTQRYKLRVVERVLPLSTIFGMTLTDDRCKSILTYLPLLSIPHTAARHAVIRGRYLSFLSQSNSRRYLCHLITCADIVTPGQGDVPVASRLGGLGLYGRERRLATAPHVVSNPYQLARRLAMGLLSILRGLANTMLTSPCARLIEFDKEEKGRGDSGDTDRLSIT